MGKQTFQKCIGSVLNQQTKPKSSQLFIEYVLMLKNGDLNFEEVN